MTRDRGFVLINALVLVAAFAAAAVFLLSRAETARVRQAGGQSAAQARLYLDSLEALAMTRLDADQRAGTVDASGEAWAAALSDVTLDRGDASGRITDLQGLFNINWLANPEDAVARDGFRRLVADLGLAPRVARVITEFVSPGGPHDLAAYARHDPAIRPVGGPILIPDQIQVIPTLRPRDYAALRPYITALPGDMTLNVNTAPAPVLASLLPGVSAEALARLTERRKRTPFEAIETFTAALATGTEVDETRFGVGSNWFRADSAVRLEGRIVKRRTVLERQPLPRGARVAYRLEDWNWQ